MNRICKRILRSVCVALSLAVLVAPALVFAAQIESPATEDSPVSYTATIHASASYGSASIGQMADGTLVTILDTKGEFYKIDCYDMTGYIAKSQIQAQEDRTYIQCDPDSSESQVITYLPRTEVLEIRNSLRALAEDQLGAPYVYGRSRPGGFDCSGLTYYLYGCHDTTLKRTASGQLSDGLIVAREDMQVGDLVFFRESWESALTSHVGIYVGDNQIIHAGSGGVKCVTLTGEYFDGNFQCARRIICTDTAELEQLPEWNTQPEILITQSITGRQAIGN